MAPDDSEKLLRVSLSAVSSPRVKRLLGRSASLGTWPGFRHLFELVASNGQVVEFSVEEFDAVYSLLQLFEAEPAMEPPLFDQIVDSVVVKVAAKGGVRCDPTQIPDIAFEAHVAILLKRYASPWFRFQQEDLNQPDGVFAVQFFGSDDPSLIAIECKNVSNDHPDIRSLIVSVARAIRKAARQHEVRCHEYTDLIVFVDLPIWILGRPGHDYERLVVNVFRSLERSGHGWIDESQVIFTATSQREIGRHLIGGSVSLGNLTLMRPVCCGKTSLVVRAPRAIFLSALYREHGENLNIGNWSKHALFVPDPQRYYIDLQDFEGNSSDAREPFN